MQELPNLHRNYSSGANIEGSVHPIEENILLLNNIGIYNYTAVVQVCVCFKYVVWISLFHCIKQ